MNYYLLALVSIFTGSLGQVCLKFGANKIKNMSFALPSLWNTLAHLIRTVEIPLGFTFFGVSSLIWIKVLTRMELSTAYPLVSLGYILVAVLSYFLFQENFSITKIAGILVIVTGVILISK